MLDPRSLLLVPVPVPVLLVGFLANPAWYARLGLALRRRDPVARAER